MESSSYSKEGQGCLGHVIIHGRMVQAAHDGSSRVPNGFAATVVHHIGFGVSFFMGDTQVTSGDTLHSVGQWAAVSQGSRIFFDCLSVSLN